MLGSKKFGGFVLVALIFAWGAVAKADVWTTPKAGETCEQACNWLDVQCENGMVSKHPNDLKKDYSWNGQTKGGNCGCKTKNYTCYNPKCAMDVELYLEESTVSGTFVPDICEDL